jgi:Uma2 family endonuclease
MTIEMLSPDQNQTKVTRNISHCLDHGCQLGWLLDPATQMVIADPADQRSQTFSEAANVLPVPAFRANFTLTLGELLG